MYLNEIEICNLVGESIYRRGYSYYRAGKIKSVEQSSSSSLYIANVSGSSNRLYNLFIDLRKERFYCDCPYPGKCKHLAAVLIYLYENRVEEKSIGEMWKGVEKESKSIKTSEDVVLQLKQTNKSRAMKELKCRLDSESLNQFKSQKRYLPIFILDNDFWSNMNSIKLKMRYVKKDGTLGALYSYSESKIPEIRSCPFYDLIHIIDSLPEQRVPLQMIINRILEDDIEIFSMENNRDIFNVKKKEFNKLQIGFDICRIEDQNVLFNMQVFAENDNDSSFNLLHEVEFGGGFYFTYSVREKELYYTQDSILDKFFQNVFYQNFRDEYTFDDIIAFKSLCEEYFYGKVEIKFDFDKIKIITEKSYPVLSVSDNINHIDIELDFRYLDRIFPHSESDNLLKIEPDYKSKTIILVNRNIKYEKAVNNYLKKLFEEDLLSPGEYIFYERKKANEKYSYRLHLDNYIDFMRKYGQVLIAGKIEIRIADYEGEVTAVKKKMNIKVNSGVDWFEINVKDPDDHNADLKIDPVYVKTGMIFSNNQLVILDEDDVKKLQLLQKNGLDANGRLRIPKNDLSAVHELYSKSDLEGGELLKEAALLYEKLSNIKSIKRVNLPKKFKAKLRKYQKTGYNWLNFLHENNLNGCLADDMGLGKTVQTLALLQKLQEDNKFKNALLIVPVSTIPNWIDEIERFTNGFSVLLFKGSGRKKFINSIYDYNIIITSYHTFARDVELLKEVKFTYCILDEAQNIKNASTLHFKAVKLVNSEHKLTLTGTPVENSSSELWAQMNFLNPGLLGSFKNFKKQYGIQIEIDDDMDAADKLKNKVHPFLLRRKKEDVALDLPEKEIVNYYCEMSSDQKKIYDNYKEFYRQLLLENPNVEKQDYFQYFSAILRLRQAALFPELADVKNKNISSAKFEALKEMVPEILSENHKILIFSQFVSVLKIIEKYFKKEKYQYAYLDGQTKDRKAVINSFQKDPECNLFLISLKAGGVGINLTEADYVFIFDPWWNPAVENQAIDRAHRIGQKRKVIVYKMITKDTIEEKIQVLQEKKNELVKNIISNDESVFNKLNRDDLISLLES